MRSWLQDPADEGLSAGSEGTDSCDQGCRVNNCMRCIQLLTEKSCKEKVAWSRNIMGSHMIRESADWRLIQGRLTRVFDSLDGAEPSAQPHEIL